MQSQNEMNLQRTSAWSKDTYDSMPESVSGGRAGRGGESFLEGILDYSFSFPISFLIAVALCMT